MLISEMSLENYASFASSGRLKFGPGINFIVGQNNTGKSALLQSLRPSFPQTPHRSDRMFRSEELPPSSQSGTAIFSGSELMRSWQRSTCHIQVMVNHGKPDFPGELTRFFLTDAWEANFVRSFDFKVTNQPRAALPNPKPAKFRPTMAGPVFVEWGQIGNDFATIAILAWTDALFFFDAQRYNVGRCLINMAEKLQSDAGNLPAVLMRMQGNQGDLFKSLTQHMRDIFPSVKNLSVSSPNLSQELEILVWPVIEQLHKELSTTLNESGTGLSQVLAILTVAMTMERAVIVIDEISSFLHPAAAKALVRILESHYPQHQYIISTHSPEVISACTPATVHLVTKTGFASSIIPLDVANIVDLRALTGELGVSMTDVFAADRVVWVEGPTEEAAFPYIFEQTREDSSAEQREKSPQFTAVVATGDFTARRTRPELIFDIYSRLSNAAAALSGAATFAFDAEELNDQQMADLKRQAKERLLFLPRRLFECYLIHPAAIVTVINGHLEEKPVTVTEVEAFLRANGGLAKYKAATAWTGDLSDENWLKCVDAAVLLNDLFSKVSEARLAFSKRTHSFAIVKEILATDPGFAQELIQFVKELVTLSRT
ncbi:ATP-dependent nuclease [Rhizobium laguerreae]|uniref:ATP-dependent nuclease n=1 Tax=Rhizobium laguerreae TaxID=1076926 RepID=UPI001C91AB2D|nr:AAA family ATPase [Rhizobium laguerreae]MBY3347313.1 AAA family ATPase [Rhizobium laguerreae]MBY3354419.1 AAA family ATPase [Rhizobium laguerreae]MBY3375320.1 AAA family ATPase [Rhizobium laguerreae]MBY3430550.1 AAA family ATPase [Rhizobium laguerreae]MBY3439197.1 AAA family ATPase [Rhizobium laguerreae]